MTNLEMNKDMLESYQAMYEMIMNIPEDRINKGIEDYTEGNQLMGEFIKPFWDQYQLGNFESVFVYKMYDKPLTDIINLESTTTSDIVSMLGSLWHAYMPFDEVDRSKLSTMTVGQAAEYLDSIVECGHDLITPEANYHFIYESNNFDGKAIPHYLPVNLYDLVYTIMEDLTNIVMSK